MCDHVIHRPFRMLIHENLWRNYQIYMKIYREMVFKDCKAQETKFSVEISSIMYKIVKCCGPLGQNGIIFEEVEIFQE